jgi:hypothetical protein
MNKILVFLAGVISSVAIVGGLAAWFLIFSPEAAKQTSVPIPPPVVGKAVSTPPPPASTNNEAPAPATTATPPRPVTNFPTQADQAAGGNTTVLLEGRISMPAALKKVLAQYPKASLSIRFLANTSAPTAQGNLVDQGELVNPSFPHTYSLQLNSSWVPPLRKFESFPLFVRAVVCLENREREPCNANQFPNMEASLRFRARIPADAKGTLQIPVPNLIMTRLQRKPEPAACTASGGQLAGTLIPTPAFAKTGMKRVLLVGSPYHEKRPPPPFAGPAGIEAVGKVTATDLPNLANYGITYTSVSLSGGEVKFALTIPTKFQGELYRIFYVPCQEGEQENACLLRAFPLTMLHVPGEKKAGAHSAVAVVAKNFEAPFCGMKDAAFYLHAWDYSVLRATEQTMHLANPPELIEGAVY